MGLHFCHLCGAGAESVQHLFVECPFGRVVYSAVASHLGLVYNWGNYTFVEFLSKWVEDGKKPL